ncbi:MAG: biopolymer transporter ExbD [Rickettsiales bacterium]|jgi:biopolymer transport protein TolR|nr:biopolymer transporter ExbD [Rickettsiales bacterium]
MATKIVNSRRGKRGLMSEINITPFVDVMLVLLVVFMVTAPMMISGINVNLPEATSSPLSGSDEPLTITVTNKGMVYIQDVVVNKTGLIPKLKAITKEQKDSRILVRGDRATNYGDVMSVIGAINEAGYNHISLVTQIENKK